MSISNGYFKTRRDKKCSLCRECLPSKESCNCHMVRCNGEQLSRIPFGDEEYEWGTIHCLHCGVSKGGYHHENCSQEICPMCGEILNLCDCDTEFIV